MTDQNINWNEKAGVKWAEMDEELSRFKAPLLDTLVNAAKLRPTDHVLDIGCGAGSSTEILDASCAKVTAIDISVPLLKIARSRNLHRTDFIHDSAETHHFTEHYDLAFSLSGVMFFDDDIAAFKHIHSAMKPSGRLAFSCWQHPDQNGWVTVARTLRSQYVDFPDFDFTQPGPFRFCDPEKIKNILEQAGFNDIKATPFSAPLPIGRNTDEALHFVKTIGPAASLIAELEADQKMLFEEQMLKEIEKRDAKLDGAIWIVTASA